MMCKVTPILVFFVLEASTSVIHFNSECCPRLTEEPVKIFICLTPGEAPTWGRPEERDWRPLSCNYSPSDPFLPPCSPLIKLYPTVPNKSFKPSPGLGSSDGVKVSVERGLSRSESLVPSNRESSLLTEFSSNLSKSLGRSSSFCLSELLYHIVWQKL